MWKSVFSIRTPRECHAEDRRSVAEERVSSDQLRVEMKSRHAWEIEVLKDRSSDWTSEIWATRLYRAKRVGGIASSRSAPLGH